MFVSPAFSQDAPTGQADGEAVAGSGEVLTGTEVAQDGNAKAAFPPFETQTFPSQILWLAITFGLFYIFLKRVALPRLAGILEVRRDRIAGDLDQAARLKQEADEAIAAYEQGLADARKKAGQIGQKARDGAKAEADAERKRIEAALDTRLAAAEARISDIKASAMKDVGAIAEETAGAIVQALIGDSVAQGDVTAAVRAASE
jgi:F-type H+-transporting ATPase subunit b